MNAITRHLKVMNPMEVVLNMGQDELSAEFDKLPKDEQESFLKELKSDFAEVKNTIEGFIKTKSE